MCCHLANIFHVPLAVATAIVVAIVVVAVVVLPLLVVVATDTVLFLLLLLCQLLQVLCRIFGVRFSIHLPQRQTVIQCFPVNNSTEKFIKLHHTQTNSHTHTHRETCGRVSLFLFFFNCLENKSP